MKPKNTVILALIIFVLGLIGCSGGGGSSSASSAPPPAVVTGSAVKGPVEGATVQLFYFDNNGDQIEIVSPAAPVNTDASGAFSFPVNGQDLMGITSPVLVRTSGGTMGGESAPQLAAIIADPMPLTFSQVSLTCHLSVASSVAAGLLINEAQTIGAAPTRDDADWFMDLVESQLQVGLADDPADPRTPNGMFNYCIDQNLGLETQPDEADELVMDLIAYFTANLSSQSGILDEWMDDPGDPGTDIPAAFTPFGVETGDLASLLAGPQDFIIMNLS